MSSARPPGHRPRPMQNPIHIIDPTTSTRIRNHDPHYTTKLEKEPPHSFTKPLPPLPFGPPLSEPKSHCPYPSKLQGPPLSVAKNKLDQIVSNISGKIDSRRLEEVSHTPEPPPEIQASTSNTPSEIPTKPQIHRITSNPNTRTTTPYTATGKCQNPTIHGHPQAQHTLTPSSRTTQTTHTSRNDLHHRPSIQRRMVDEHN